MDVNQTDREKFKGLRRKAEAALRKKKKSPAFSVSDQTELLELLHNLEVHQIELEMQNDELLKTRRELEASREDFFNLYEMSPVGYLVLDKKGTILRANLAFSEMINKERRYLHNSIFLGFIPRQDRGLVSTAIRNALGGKNKETCEVKLVPKDGLTTLDVQLEIVASRNVEGAQSGVLVAVIDISQRKEAEALVKKGFDRLDEMVREKTEDLRQANLRLMESEEKFRTVADSTNDWEYWQGPDGVYRYVSPSCKKITGYPVEMFVSEPDFILALIHPDDRKRAAAHFRAELESREINEIEFRIVDADGRIKWIAHSCHPVFDADGKYNGRRSSNRDISEQKALEDDLVRQEIQFRLAMDASSDGLWDMDVRSGSVYFGENWLKSMGYSSAEFDWSRQVHPEDRERVLKVRDAHLKGETERHEVEYRIKDKNDKYHWVLSRGQVIEWDSLGLPKRMIGTYTDITGIKQVELELAQSRLELESRVAARTAELEETNIALRVLLQKRARDREVFEQHIMANVEGLIEPYLDKLQDTRLDVQQENLITLLRENLQEICSPFSNTLSSKLMKLTPTEIKVANLVKVGKSTKEIAEFLNLSPGTINIHRKNIRKKLGMTNQKTNLQTNLSGISRGVTSDNP